MTVANLKRFVVAIAKVFDDKKQALKRAVVIQGSRDDRRYP